MLKNLSLPKYLFNAAEDFRKIKTVCTPKTDLAERIYTPTHTHKRNKSKQGYLDAVLGGVGDRRGRGTEGGRGEGGPGEWEGR